MIGKCGRAVFAGGNAAAIAAHEKRGEAARLCRSTPSAASPRHPASIVQGAGEDGARSACEFAPQIDDRDVGQAPGTARSGISTRVQHWPRYVPLMAPGKRLGRRRSRPQHQRDAAQPRHHGGDPRAHGSAGSTPAYRSARAPRRLMIMPSRAAGRTARIGRRPPTRAAPEPDMSHWSRTLASSEARMKTATAAPKRERNRPTVCAVSEISGTKTQADRRAQAPARLPRGTPRFCPNRSRHR